jgi:hypothetical protein
MFSKSPKPVVSMPASDLTALLVAALKIANLTVVSLPPEELQPVASLVHNTSSITNLAICTSMNARSRANSVGDEANEFEKLSGFFSNMTPNGAHLNLTTYLETD